MVEHLLTYYLRRINRRDLSFDPAPDIDLPPPRDRKYLLYVHIPFCAVLCPFCSFHRVKLKREKAANYFRALRDEIRGLSERGYDFSSVYVGGGTPTIVPHEMVEVLGLIRSLFSVSQISIETNPDDLNDEVMSQMKAAGVNRLSVGVQSFDDRLLKQMDRYAKYGSGARIMERLQEAQGRFDTLNADMIFNIPRQTRSSLVRDIHILTEVVKVDQATFYPLMESTATKRAMSKKMGQVTYHREKDYYHLIVEGMRRDYQRSTSWCFSRTGAMIDEYIVAEDEYVAVGSGAFSYLDGVAYSSTFSINRYIDSIDNGRIAITAKKPFDLHEQMRYDLMMTLFGLRLDKKVMVERYGKRFFQVLWKELLGLRLAGALEDHGDHYRLTDKGMYYWVVMMREFFIGVNNFREQMRSHIKEERDPDA